MPHAVAIIPARYASTRFPGKPLALVQGQPMIQHVYRRVSQAATVERVIVATDDQRIADVVRAFDGEVAMTSSEHATGTDRLAEVVARLDCELVVNVQGDEPLIDPRMIDQAVMPLSQDSSIEMGTLASPIEYCDDFRNPNVVKVVRAASGLALYFSRAPIPWPRDLNEEDLVERLPELGLLRHIGLYVYRRTLLLDYPNWPEGRLERLESLEQLRALERGIKLHVALTDQACHGVDVPADIERIETLMEAADDSF